MRERTLSRNSGGFTIVELLIVIIVIAVIATITIVAYTGVQNQSIDTKVRNDLVNISKKFELYHMDNGSYPYGTPLNMANYFTVPVSRSSYDLTKDYQLLVCTDSAKPGSTYAVLAVSRAGTRLYVGSATGGVKEYTGATAWLTTAACSSGVLPGPGAGSALGAGYALAGGDTGWRPWITDGD